MRLARTREQPRARSARALRTDGGRRTQLRDVKAGSSYLSQNDLRAHFGLGGGHDVDRLEIRWPNGESETLKSVAANQIVTIAEGKGVTGSVTMKKVAGFLGSWVAGKIPNNPAT